MKNFLFPIESFWRYKILYPFLRRTIGRRETEEAIDLTKIRKILFLRYDRIGDMIVTTPIFRFLKQNYPLLKICVLASEANEEIIRYNNAVDAIYILPRSRLERISILKKIRSENYDVVVNFIFNRTTSIALLLNFIAKKSICVSQGDEKYRFYFNRYCTLPRFSEPMAHTLARMMRTIFSLKLDITGLEYEIIVDTRTRDEVALFLSKHGLQAKNSEKPSNYIVFNLSAVDAERKISIDQVNSLVSFLSCYSSYNIVFVTDPKDGVMQKQASLLASPRHILFMEKGYGSLLHLAVVIEGTAVVLSPDTSIIHFASAMKTPVAGFFTPLQGMQEWLPLNVKNTCIIAEAGLPVSKIPICELTKNIGIFLDKILEKPKRA